jgi:hypothetical protein
MREDMYKVIVESPWELLMDRCTSGPLGHATTAERR